MNGRPERLVLVLGTGTGVGKTWVTCRVAETLRAAGTSVAARKPVQSWDPDEVAAGMPTDASALGAATGEVPDAVCLPTRSYPIAVAPPMAAARLGRGPLRLADLVAELSWPLLTNVGLVEAAGGTRSPMADDGDGVDLAGALTPDLIVLVAGAGLGTLHAVRAAAERLRDRTLVVHLNQFDPGNELHDENRRWLADRDGFDVSVDISSLVARLV
jgi:dethiobiotin synthetase